MKTAFLMGGLVPMDIEVIDGFYHHYPAVRRAGQLAVEATGLSPEAASAPGPISQAIIVLGICDTLIERGIRPDVVAGLSLGAHIAPCVAGSFDRHALFALIYHRRLLPPPPQSQALAALMIPGDDDPSAYYGASRPGVFLAVDHGPLYGGAIRRLLVGGEWSAIQRLGEDLDPAVFRLLDGYRGANHTPLQQYASEFISSYLRDMTFQDPTIPLCSPTEARLLATAADVREFLCAIDVTTMRMVPVVEEMTHIGTQVVFTLGPGVAPGISTGEMDLISVIKPGDLDNAVELAQRYMDKPTADTAGDVDVQQPRP